MTSWIKKMCSHRSLTSTANTVYQARGEHDSDISPDVEVNLIKTFLERKLNRKFQIRVRAEGYLGEEMNYRLVVDNYCTNDPQNKYYSIYGYETSNILDVKREFLKSYWDRVQTVHDSVGKSLDKWDSDRIAGYKDTMVVSSREELLIRADLEGLR